MAYTTFEYSSANYGGSPEHSTDNSNTITLGAAQGDQLALPDSSYVTEADILRDGLDLILDTPEGMVVIEGYFAQEPPPSLVAPDGKTLTPDLVESFAHSPQEYASSEQTTTDVSPVGAVQEITGEARVIHTDGTIEVIGVGTHIYQGDIIETEEDGAVNIMFIDETTFAISEDARLAIDEYVFDPATQSGTTNFSVLKGVFVFTSGLIGREDPDDVMIDTPSGSIGIRGTIIAGDVDNGEITVIEGAIVLYDFNGNTVTLSNQYETARFNTSEQSIDYMGELSANDVATKFTSVSNVSGDLFSSIEDSAAESQSETAEEIAPQSTEESEIGVEAESETEANAATETESEATTEPQEEQEASEEETSSEDTEGDAEGETGSGEETSSGEDGTSNTDPEDGNEEKLAEDSNSTTEVITSDEITGSNVEDLSNNDTETLESQDDASEATETTANNVSDTTESGEETTLPDADTSEQPSFYINVIQHHVQEGAPANTVVAHVIGNFTEVTNLWVTGISSNYYVAERVDANTFVIRTTVTIDAEDYHPLRITATNDLETSVITQTVPLDLGLINEPIDFLNYAGNIGYNFIGSNGSQTIYDLSQEFTDPEGRISHYSISNLSSNANFDAGGTIEIDENGQLIVILDSAVTPETITFDITAHTSDGQTEIQTFSFDAVAATTHSGTTLDTSMEVGTVFSTDAIMIDINDASRTIYANSTNTDKNVIINESDATVVLGGDTDNVDNIYIYNVNANVKAGEGNDNFYISSNNYSVYGDGGNDTFESYSVVGNIYGGTGNDEINIDGTTISMLTGAHTIDGGAGNDELFFNITGNLDFSSIPTNVLQNLETISFTNSSANIIDLTYDEVVSMTDGDNVLIIKTDSTVTDTVNFDRAGHTFVHTGTANPEGDNVYHVFTDGNVTLLVDADAVINI